MSRHQLVKNLDLHDELDDFDGGDDYADEEEEGAEELSEEDREQMRLGMLAVRDTLGEDFDVSDKEVKDALWHYYYDVEKSVEYLLTTRMPKQKKKKKAKELRFMYDTQDVSHVTTSIPADFWADMQWFNTPVERHATFVQPACPRGGLLGGAPEAAPKMSKLQALAAARKKKAQEQKNKEESGVDTPMAGLAISESTRASKITTSPPMTSSSASAAPEDRSASRTYPVRKRKSSSPHKKTSQPAEPIEVDADVIAQPGLPVPEVEQAAPSAFANTMFSKPTSAAKKPTGALFSLPYLLQPNMQSTDAFTGPSPDDIVIAAQSKAANAKAAKASKGPAKTNGEKKADQIANSVEALKIDDTPRATSKNLDVLAEYEKAKRKNAANFVVIGHVDAGKSTLMGRLLYDLNVVDKRTIDKYRKEAEKMGKSSFALAWVLDQGTEERTRGVTIDIAMNKFETEKTSFTILDAPGHRDFIPNMIAGASQADFAVLVIDASTGSFESGLRGQTKEHALLVRSMGVQRLIVAINKLDTVSWSQDRFTEISQQVSAFLLAAGFQSKNISFIPLSGLHGDNIVTRATSPEAAWYQGNTLVGELDNSEPIARALEKPLRVTIGDIFRGGVQNPLSISGRIEAGSLQTGDALISQPANEKCFIKALEIDNETADWAVAGQNVTIHLSDIDPIHLKIGDVLCSPANPIPSVQEFTAKVLAFEFLIPGSVDVHRGRLHAAGKIKEVLASLDKSTGAVIKKRPRVVKPGGVARVVVELDAATPLEKGQRVVLRSGGETIAAGLLE